MQPAFDVINLDACDHLAYKPKGRDKSTFDALQSLLHHQVLNARYPWLLFITTRLDAALAGTPSIAFQKAITENIAQSPDEFGAAAANLLNASTTTLATALNQAWTAADSRYVRIYSLGLAKFLLQFFHAQPNLPARVELASAYSYRVHSPEPDMVALAFRISPQKPRIYGPNVGGSASLPELEVKHGLQMVQKVGRISDLDEEIKDEQLLKRAVSQVEALLDQRHYDLVAWRKWIKGHPLRPIVWVDSQ